MDQIKKWHKAGFHRTGSKVLYKYKNKFDMITKLHHRTAQTLIRDMWNVDWFENVYTGGCYTESDFWSDLTTTCAEEDVLELREAADQNKNAEWYYEIFCARF